MSPHCVVNTIAEVNTGAGSSEEGQVIRRVLGRGVRKSFQKELRAQLNGKDIIIIQRNGEATCPRQGSMVFLGYCRGYDNIIQAGMH